MHSTNMSTISLSHFDCGILASLIHSGILVCRLAAGNLESDDLFPPFLEFWSPALLRMLPCCGLRWAMVGTGTFQCFSVWNSTWAWTLQLIFDFIWGLKLRQRYLFHCPRARVADPVPDQGGQKWPTKKEKSTEFSCFEVLDVLFWGLKASPLAWAPFMEAILQFLIQNTQIKFHAVIFLNFRSLNPGSGSGSAIRTKCWIRIRIKSMRIHNPAEGQLRKHSQLLSKIGIWSTENRKYLGVFGLCVFGNRLCD